MEIDPPPAQSACLHVLKTSDLSYCIYLSISSMYLLHLPNTHFHTNLKSHCEPSSQSLQTVSSIYLFSSCYFSPVGWSKVMSTRDLFLCCVPVWAHVCACALVYLSVCICVLACQCPHCSQIRLILQTPWPWARSASCLSLTGFLPGGSRGLIK